MLAIYMCAAYMQRKREEEALERCSTCRERRVRESSKGKTPLRIKGVGVLLHSGHGIHIERAPQ